MTIRQQGGIFGRNPKFNDVEANSLDVSGSISTAGLDVSGAVTVDGLTSDGNVTVQSTAPILNLVDTDGQSGRVRVTSSAMLVEMDAGQTGPASSLQVKVDNSEVMRFTSSSATVYKNLVIANAGNGIDFSATSGTGTSELFDDYEEGTWTVQFSDASSGGNVSSTTYTGQYIKIGSVVHCWFNAVNINENGLTDANNLYFNLPFTAGTRGSSGSCRTGVLTYPAGTTVITPTASTSAYGWFFASGDGVNAAVLTCGALNSGDSSDLNDVTLTYTTI